MDANPPEPKPAPVRLYEKPGIATETGSTEVPFRRVYEEKCVICDEACYVSSSSSSSMLSSALQIRQVIYGAFGIQVNSSFFHDFQEGLPLCVLCSFKVGRLQTMQQQMTNLELNYDRLRFQMALSMVKALGAKSDGKGNTKTQITAVNLSPSKLLKSLRDSEVETLQQLVFEGFHDQVVQDEEEAFNFQIPIRTGEPKQYRNKKLVNISRKRASQNSVPSLVNDEYQGQNVDCVVSKNNSEKEKTDICQEVCKSIEKKTQLSKADGSDKEIQNHHAVENKSPSSVEPEQKPKDANLVDVLSNVNTEDNSDSEDAGNFEGALPNHYEGETITLSMSPTLFRNGGYSTTEYGDEDESGDDAIKFSKDATGTEAFEDDSFEEHVDDGSLTKHSPTLEITEYDAGVHFLNGNHADNQSEIAMDDGDSRSDLESNEMEASSEPTSPQRNFRGLVDEFELQQNASGLYECMFCGKTFIHKYPYRDHLKTHTGEGPRCDLCKKIFPKNHNLMLHMRTHTGEKPYICTICKKGFADKSNLKVHMRVHTGERPYRCEYCDQGFVNSSRLIVHRRLHTGEKPFPCDYCSRSFATSNQLSSHVKNHFNENKPFKCAECGRAYTNATSLQAHINVHHK